ncbi:hypothetical protein [Nitrosomonas supralitoralis]|uniref:Uncharacterized protein n=1 Tax=Nitrosomonas supralitoralis TaxID=2116706 RepID=A0A2P7NR50_9PROT|nr:hypothetical protein [Nitrosomonas supralitoralis]PSJ15934.1 hypothetical protein C7H79_16290 [Nitrosomonas supralitoralis]
MKRKGRGGKREGAGRKKDTSGIIKYRVSFTLPVDIINFLKTRKQPSQFVEIAIRRYAAECENSDNKDE